VTTTDDWAKAIENARDPLPMEPEIWAAGADLDSAHFVAHELRQQGYYLVRADDLGWPEIRAFEAELDKGQDIREDAGGFFIRAIMALFGRKPTDPVTNYQQAAQALLDEMERSTP
jgi:hypothetical protein